MNLSLLILTDFFKAADLALAYATNLVKPLGARQVLLHVRRDSVLDPETLTGGLLNHSQEAAATALHSLVSHLPGPATAEIGHGRVAAAVADAVRRHHPALVVLGRPDTEDIPDELVNTTALDLLRTAPQPMLVVPHTVRATHPPRRVLLAVDAEAFSLGQYTGMVRHLFTALKAEVTVLHVTEIQGSGDDMSQAMAAVQGTGLTANLLRPVTTRTILNADPADGILKAAQPEETDLVVLIARPRSFLGELFHHSVTAQVLLHSTVPVLVLPATE